MAIEICRYSHLVVTANETGVNDLSLFLAVVTAMVRDGVIIVGVLIVVVVQRGFDFVVSFCLGSVQFCCAIEP